MWLKGNLHTHTHETDGDAPPDKVVEWYATHGYDFLAITDHNKLTLPTSDRLLLIPSTEITLTSEGKPVHVNAFNIGMMPVLPERHVSVVEMLQRGINAARAIGGVAMINHPNFRWAFGPDEL